MRIDRLVLILTGISSTLWAMNLMAYVQVPKLADLYAELHPGSRHRAESSEVYLFVLPLMSLLLIAAGTASHLLRRTDARSESGWPGLVFPGVIYGAFVIGSLLRIRAVSWHFDIHLIDALI